MTLIHPLIGKIRGKIDGDHDDNVMWCGYPEAFGCAVLVKYITSRDDKGTTVQSFYVACFDDQGNAEWTQLVETRRLRP